MLAIIQARMNSTRLPSKVMKEVCGKPLIGHMLHRLGFSKKISPIVVATSIDQSDDALAEYVESLGIQVFRGSQDDVLERYFLAAKSYKAEHVMRLTADCPLIDPSLCDLLVKTYFEKKIDLIDTGPSYAEGMSGEIFSFKALEKSYKEARLPSEREHVSLYIKNHPEMFKCCLLESETDDSRYRITVDEPQDLEVVSKVFEHFQGRDFFTYAEIKSFLDAHPQIMKLNADIVRSEGLHISLRKDKDTHINITVKIGKREISQSSPAYIIAEMSANHGGDFDKAIKILHAAKKSGADALKLQTYRAHTMTLDSNKKDFLIPSDNPWGAHKTLYSLYEKATTPWEWHRDLIKEGQKIGIEVFSSPFDVSAVDFLEKLNVPAYKIASPEISDIPLIKRVGQTGKPVLISTGLAELEDIELAVKTLRQEGCKDICLLKCTSAYPAPANEINMRTIPDMIQRFNCLAGISDHTLGIGVPVAAVALGARVIEKHFILDKKDDSVDGFFSLDPMEFKMMVDEIRKIEQALGQVDYSISSGSKKNLFAKRSLYVAKDIKKGEVLTGENIKSVRPFHGLHPKHYEEVLGKKASRDLERGDRLFWDVIE